MITINKECTYNLIYNLSGRFPDKRICFFDIETTGLSRHKSMIYLIGLCYYENNTCYSTLYFNDDGLSEHLLLSSLNEYIKDFDIVITFNGDSFDIPFVIERSKINHLSLSFDNIASVDMFKLAKKYKKYLNLPNLKQKTIELFMGINREDIYDGGKLINVYMDYLNTHSDELYELLILHNYEDILGMVKLCEIFAYFDMFDAVAEYETCKINNDKLCIYYKLKTALINPFTYSTDYYVLSASKDNCLVMLNCIDTELKHFYSDYKNYYYLPAEDNAIHKSVAEFVDKNYREKATKNNCYTRKTGVFCMQPEEIIHPAFKYLYNDKISYFLAEDFKSDNNTAITYMKALLHFTK